MLFLKKKIITRKFNVSYVAAMIFLLDSTYIQTLKESENLRAENYLNQSIHFTAEETEAQRK